MKYIKELKGRLRSLLGSKKTTHNLVEVFTHEGHTYYRFPKEVNLPLERFSMSMSASFVAVNTIVSVKSKTSIRGRQ